MQKNNTKDPIFEDGAREIREIKMTSLERENMLQSILTYQIPKIKPIKSPDLFISILNKNTFAYTVVILCLIIVSGGVGFNYFRNSSTSNSEIAKVDTGKTTTPTKEAPGDSILNKKNTKDPQIARSTNSPVSKDRSPMNTDRYTEVSATMQNTTEGKIIPINEGVKKAFSLYKNGQISECTTNGKTYYSASLNEYDGDGSTFDVNGKVVGGYQGFTGKYVGINLENCERIYVVSPNIWGYEAINKYNLK